MPIERYVLYMPNIRTDQTHGVRGYIDRNEIHRQLTKIAQSPNHRFTLTKLDAGMRLECYFQDAIPNWSNADEWFRKNCTEPVLSVLDISDIKAGDLIQISGMVSSALRKNDDRDIHVNNKPDAEIAIAEKLNKKGLQVQSIIVTRFRRIAVVRDGKTSLQGAYHFMATCECLDTQPLTGLITNGIGKKKFLGFGLIRINAHKQMV